MITNNEDLRVKYLLNEIEEPEFKKIIQQREKKNEKTRDIIQVLRMFIITTSDMLRQLVLRQIKIELFCTEVENLTIYVNNSLETISKRYNSKKYYIDKNWNFN